LKVARREIEFDGGEGGNGAYSRNGCLKGEWHRFATYLKK